MMIQSFNDTSGSLNKISYFKEGALPIIYVSFALSKNIAGIAETKKRYPKLSWARPTLQ
jgi:hypothetical protein